MKDCGVEKVMRDLRIFRIFEGIHYNLVAKYEQFVSKCV